jgi:NAD(P)-dependent dehydrogenase (short-subunit alcohol dehydrogenase family)
MERWGTTNEIASTACFLLSDSAGYISGVDLLVDGAMCQSEPPGAFLSREIGKLMKAGL